MQIRLHLAQPHLQLGIEFVDNQRFAVFPVVNVFRQRALHPHRFAQPLRRDFAPIDALAPLPQHPAELAEALEELRQIVLLHVGAGDKPHLFQPLGGHLADAGDLAERQLLQNAGTCAGVITYCPFGLLISEAILARNLIGAIPAEAVRFSSSAIAWRISWAISVAEPLHCGLSVTSR